MLHRQGEVKNKTAKQRIWFRVRSSIRCYKTSDWCSFSREIHNRVSRCKSKCRKNVSFLSWHWVRTMWCGQKDMWEIQSNQIMNQTTDSASEFNHLATDSCAAEQLLRLIPSCSLTNDLFTDCSLSHEHVSNPTDDWRSFWTNESRKKVSRESMACTGPAVRPALLFPLMSSSSQQSVLNAIIRW